MKNGFGHADMVRGRLNLTLEDTDDSKVNEMIQYATATIALEVGRNLDYSNCSDAEAAAVKNLAAVAVRVWRNFAGGALSNERRYSSCQG